MLLVLNVLVMNLFPAVMSFNLRKMIREDEEEKEHQALKAKQAEKQKENNGSAADDHEISQFEEHMVKLQVTTDRATHVHVHSSWERESSVRLCHACTHSSWEREQRTTVPRMHA